MGEKSPQYRHPIHSSGCHRQSLPLTSESISGYFRPLLLPKHLVFPPSSSWHQNPFFGSNLWRWGKPVDGTWSSPPSSHLKAMFTVAQPRRSQNPLPSALPGTHRLCGAHIVGSSFDPWLHHTRLPFLPSRGQLTCSEPSLPAGRQSSSAIPNRNTSHPF